jgi:hypothetical protein
LDRKVWLRLSRLQLSGARLTEAAMSTLQSLVEKRGASEENGRDEFPVWSEGGFASADATEVSRITQMTPDAFAEEVFSGTDRRPFSRWDLNWEAAIHQDPQKALAKIAAIDRDLGSAAGAWRRFLWTVQPSLNGPSPAGHRAAAALDPNSVNPVLMALHEGLLAKIVDAAAGWLRSHRKTLTKEGNDSFLTLWDRLWQCAAWEVDSRDSYTVNDALNLAGGVLLFEGREYRPGDGLHEPYRKRFDRVAAASSPAGRLGRVILATRLNALFLLDADWTKNPLLTCFDLPFSGEARDLWSAFMSYPQISEPLFSALSDRLCEIFKNPENYLDRQICSNARQLFAALALDPPGLIERNRARSILQGYDGRARTDVARYVWNFVKEQPEMAAERWRTIVAPFLQSRWPGDNVNNHDGLSGMLARLALSAGDAFPQAVAVLADLIHLHSDAARRILSLLNQHSAPKRYPAEVLELLGKLVPDGSRLGEALSKVLDEIVKAAPQLADDPRVDRLRRCA